MGEPVKKLEVTRDANSTSQSGMQKIQAWFKKAADLQPDPNVAAQMARGKFWFTLCCVMAVIPTWINIAALGDSHDPATEWLMGSSYLWLPIALAIGLVALWHAGRAFARYGSPVDQEAAVAPHLYPVKAVTEQSAPAALLVVHGIGIQERGDTLNSAVRGLVDGLVDHPAGFEHAGQAYLNKVPAHCGEEDTEGIRVRQRGTGKTLDVYEVYWAPLVEGVMSWKDVLLWAGGRITRLNRRLGMLFFGSRALPHPADVKDSRRKEWIEQVNRVIKRKIAYSFTWLGVMLAFASLLGYLVMLCWQVGLGMTAPPWVTVDAARAAVEHASDPFVVDRLNLVNPDPTVHAVNQACSAGCTVLEKLRLARALGARISVFEYGSLSQWALGHRAGETLLVFVATMLFAYTLIHVLAASRRISRAVKFPLISDLHFNHQRFQRQLLRSSTRALGGMALFMMLLSVLVTLALHHIGGLGNPIGVDSRLVAEARATLQTRGDDVSGLKADPAKYASVKGDEVGLLGVTALLLAVGATYGIWTGAVKPGLTRVLADVPIQATQSVYSAGHQARQNVLEKMIGMLGQVLKQYPSVTVLAHSQGTVVSYEALLEYQRRAERQEVEPTADELSSLEGLKSYVTIGVALSKVHDLVQGYDNKGAIDRPVNQRIFDTSGIEGVDYYYPCVGRTRWYNYWYMSDLVANPIQDYLPVEETLAPWHTGIVLPRALWTHSDYWESVGFYEYLVDGPLTRSLRTTKAQPEESPEAVARRAMQQAAASSQPT